MRRRSRPPNLSILIPGVILTLLAGAMCIWPPSLVVFLEGKVYDSFLRAAPHRQVTGAVTIVDLDEESLASMGQWPWTRYRVAHLLEKIRESGASSVGLDMVFAEPDRTSLELLSGEIFRDLGVDLPLAGIPPEAINSDQALALTLGAGPFVLGYQFDFDAARGESCILHPLRAAVHSSGGTEGAGSLFDPPGVVCNLPALAHAAGSSGFFNVTPDSDGVLRRIPLIIRHKGLLYPSLALAVYMRSRGGDAVLETGPEGVEALRLNGTSIPLDRRGNLLVNYRGRRHVFPHVSAAAILGGTADPAALKGKMVMLGTTAAGLKEIRTTPLEAAQPGVEIHATVIDNLLAGDPIATPRWARGLQIVLVLLPGFFLTALLSRERAIWGLAAALPSTAGIWIGSYLLLSHRQVFLPPVIPVSTLLLVFTVLTSLRYLQADREIRVRTRKLALTQDAIIQSLAALAETRHHETGGHIQRTRHYMRVLAKCLQDHPRFRHYLEDSAVELLFRLAPLHDIGKVGVGDEILLKPETLTPEEYEEMKRHTLYGSETIRLAKSFLGEDSFLEVADEIILNHHERWDGTGYPRGLRGEEIPIPGRLMAVADTYDAIITTRGYQAALPHEEAVRIMREKRGTHFDPDVTDAFLEIQDEFRQIAIRFIGTGVEREPPAGF
ncbi:MAG: CHASE2 domain-containing protein [Candidatus Deferrimicrobiaceae bacterium]